MWYDCDIGATRDSGMSQSVKRLVVGLSGSSGAILGIRLLQILRTLEIETHLVLTRAARLTIAQETDWKLRDVLALADVAYADPDIGAAIASGSFATLGMVVAPCSIKTLSAIANSYAAGLLVRQTRAARMLHPVGSPALTEAERQQIAAHKQLAARKLKMACALGTAGLLEETREALLVAIHAGSRALAVEHRLPEPGKPEDAVLPPLALHWGEALLVLRAFVDDPGHDWKPVSEALTKFTAR